jgi:hypothetical protein
MTTDPHLECERQCLRLCHDFVWLIDGNQYEAFLELFTSDGTFERAGAVCTGHAAIQQFLVSRPIHRVTRHLCSNVRITMTTAITAVGSCTAMMFHATTEAGTQSPLPVSAPMVVDYQDAFELTESGWKIKHRKVQVVFQ